MKYTNARAFEKHLEAAAPQHFSNLYMILVKEAFARKTMVDLLVRVLLKEEKTPEMSVRLFDAESHSILDILSELQASTLFAKKRVLLLQNADSLDKAAMGKLEAYFAMPNPAVYLVITATTVNRATNFYKKAEKAGIILDIAEEKPWEKEKQLAEWLHEEARKQGKHIEMQTCGILLKQLGTDQALLHQELEKLINYTGERKDITPQDISVICIHVNVENIWQLGEAIFRKDTASALRIGKALLSEGVALIALLRQIRAQFQTEYQVCSILSAGGNSFDVTQQFPYMKGHILERHLQLAQHYGMQNFKNGILKIDETELQAKNSAADPDVLADRLFVRLTT